VRTVFNVGKALLYCNNNNNNNKMPSHIYISREEKNIPSFKAAKDHLILLFGGNAEGDITFKPFLMYHSGNPRTVKRYTKSCLPLVWQVNKSLDNGILFLGLGYVLLLSLHQEVL
jgi:hypothetical protein